MSDDEKLIAALRGNLQRAREELAAELNRQHEEEVSAFRAERDAALAVIEQVRKVVDGERIPDEVHGDDWILAEHFQTILATSAPFALDAVKAAAWDEGHEQGYDSGLYADDDDERETLETRSLAKNPHRKTGEQSNG